MPIVPTYGDFKQTPTASAPTVSTGYNAQDATGQQLQRTGAALEGAGDAAARIAIDATDVANQVAVNKAVDQTRRTILDLTFNPETGYKSQLGLAAVQRESGQALSDEYGGKLNEAISNIGSGLTNDRQRMLFQQSAANLDTDFRRGAEEHMQEQFQRARASTNSGTIDTSSDFAKLHWDDPASIQSSLGMAKAAVYDQSKQFGWSGAQTDAAMLATTSGVHKGVIMAAMANNNPTYAIGYLDHYKGEMKPDDILGVQGHLNQQVWATQAQQAVAAATTAARPAIQPNDFDRMTAITAQSESGNKDFNPDGSVVTSPVGAKGRMQVMDATAANPGFGIRPADLSGTPQQQAAERQRVGTEYLQALVQKYGDPGKAWAAYNAGPGRLDQALKDAAAGRSGSPDWLSYMPKETQAYVAKNVAALGSPGGGVPPRMTELEFVDKALGALPPGAAPQAVLHTREQAVAQFGIISKTLAEQGQNALAGVQRWLWENKDRGVTVGDVPPSLMDPLVRSGVGDMRSLEAYSKSIQRGDTVTDLALYNRLASYPDELARTSDVQFEMLRSKLSQADFKHFSNERANLINGATDTSAQAINSKALNDSLNTRLQALGLPIHPNYKNPADPVNQQLGSQRQFVRDSVFAAQQQAGKKFTPEELDTHIDSLFLKSDTLHNLIFSDTTKPLMSVKFDDIRSADKDAITAAFVARGVKNPTNDQVLRAYWAKKAAGG